MNTFVLFGERPFNDYAYNRLSSIAQSINTMSDTEVLMYKDSFDDLVKKLVSSYSLLPVNIGFDDKIVDLISRTDHNGQHHFVEYTLMVTGDSELLRLDPYNLGYVSLLLPVEVKTNVVSFEIAIEQEETDFSPSSMNGIKERYNEIKEFMTTTLLYLNNESQKFNLQLDDFITPILAKKMRAAYNLTVIKDKLNFK